MVIGGWSLLVAVGLWREEDDHLHCGSQRCSFNWRYQAGGCFLGQTDRQIDEHLHKRSKEQNERKIIEKKEKAMDKTNGTNKENDIHG